jgi:predicted phosphodiesterase
VLASLAAAQTCRVGLVSDTHAVYDPEVIQHFLRCGVDIIIHAGDVGHHGGHEEVALALFHHVIVVRQTHSIDDSQYTGSPCINQAV